MTEKDFKEKQQGLERELLATVDLLGRHFSRSETRETVHDYLHSLLSRAERKNSWQMAEAAGQQTPYAFQYLLGRAFWDANKVRDDHVGHVLEGLGSRNGILVVDETGFLKKGDKSAGVSRQYTGTAGRIENSQVGVFLGWKTKKGHTLLDRELYLPKDWIENRERSKEAGIPENVLFATKPVIARQMIERVLRLGIRPSWVTADEVYGHDGKLRFWLEEIEQPYVMACPSNQYITRGFAQEKVGDLLSLVKGNNWTEINAGTGTKGPRIYDWAMVAINHPYGKEWARFVLFRRSLSDPKDIAFYLVYAPSKVQLKDIVMVAGARWSIEECFESAKGEVGLDQYEVRSYHGWYRHITLAMTAHALLSITRAKVFPAQNRELSPGMIEFKKKRGLLSG